MMRTSQKMMRTMKKRSVSSDHRCVCVALLNSTDSRLQYLQVHLLQQRLWCRLSCLEARDPPRRLLQGTHLRPQFRLRAWAHDNVGLCRGMLGP